MFGVDEASSRAIFETIKRVLGVNHNVFVLNRYYQARGGNTVLRCGNIYSCIFIQRCVYECSACAPDILSVCTSIA